jgi:hypothetical protein
LNRSAISLCAAAALLVAVEALPAPWHLPVAIVAWGVMRVCSPDVHAAFGRPGRWLIGLGSLAILGALLGGAQGAAGWPAALLTGAMSASSMIVRAFALVAIASVAASILPVRRWTQRARHPWVRKMMEVAVIAANLVPVQLRALSSASATLRERRPGIRRLPRRLWLLCVHSALCAAALAESVALDMAIAAHNRGSPTKETS